MQKKPSYPKICFNCFRTFLYLLELYLLSETRGPPSKNSKKEFALDYQGYIFF